jgi:hypothetical protein
MRQGKDDPDDWNAERPERTSERDQTTFLGHHHNFKTKHQHGAAYCRAGTQEQEEALPDNIKKLETPVLKQKTRCIAVCYKSLCPECCASSASCTNAVSTVLSASSTCDEPRTTTSFALNKSAAVHFSIWALVWTTASTSAVVRQPVDSTLCFTTTCEATR